MKFITDPSKIECGIVKRINFATGCEVCLDVLVNGKITGGVQELYFTSYDAAVEALKKIKQYQQIHQDLGDDWYSVYMKIIPVEHRYILKFPIKPQEPWKIEPDGTCYIANRVLADITEGNSLITYQGHNGKNYFQGKKIISEERCDWEGKESYKIVPMVQQSSSIIEV